MPVVMGSQRRMITVAEPADFIYITPGIYNLVVPAGVTSLNAIAVGAGANGDRLNGGGGGAMHYRNSVTVNPGDTILIEITAPMAVATLNNVAGRRGVCQAYRNTAIGGNTVACGYGANTYLGATRFTASAPDFSTGGGNGGQTSSGSLNGTGGGGAGSGGYTFNGTPSGRSLGAGNSPSVTTNTGPTVGSGGGAGGQRNPATTPTVRDGGGGGGIGIFGQGADGVAFSGTTGVGGGGGSTLAVTVGATTYTFGTAGVSAGTSTTHIRPDGGFPGGGGGGSGDGASFAGLGGGGVVRIFWGGGRSFPTNAAPSSNITVF